MGGLLPWEGRRAHNPHLIEAGYAEATSSIP